MSLYYYPVNGGEKETRLVDNEKGSLFLERKKGNRWIRTNQFFASIKSDTLRTGE